MVSKICLILLSVFTLVIARRNDRCLASIGWEDMCYQSISTDCKDASHSIYKPQWQSCDKIEVFWNYPTNNLTITFVAPRKPSSSKPPSYEFCLEQDGNQCVQVFRTLKSGESTKVTWDNSSTACFTNEAGKNSFKFRFQAGTTLWCYGTLIRYSIK